MKRLSLFPAWGSVNILLETEIDASSELITLMDDETGTGSLVFANTPILITPTISGLFTLSSIPTGTGVSQGTIYINPSSATADYTLLGVAVNGSSKFRVDAEGDTTISGDLTITGDDIFLTTNTIGALLVGDGTNFNPVVGTGDAEIAANGTITIVNDSHSHTSTTLPGTTSYLGSTIAADELASADFGLFSCHPYHWQLCRHNRRQRSKRNHCCQLRNRECGSNIGSCGWNHQRR